MKNIILQGKGFILRPLKKDDERAVVECANDKAVAKNLRDNFPQPYTVKDARQWIKTYLKINKNNKYPNSLAIDIDGKFCGVIGLGIREPHKGTFGYWIGKKYWGRGIGTKALRLMTQYGFQKLGLKRIEAFVYVYNKASKRILEKNGYKLEGVLRKNMKKDGKFIDTYLYAKTR